MPAHDLDILMAVVLPFGCAVILVGVFIIWRPQFLRRFFASRAAIRLVLTVGMAVTIAMAIRRDWPLTVYVLFCTLLIVRNLGRRQRPA